MREKRITAALLAICILAGLTFSGCQNAQLTTETVTVATDAPITQASTETASDATAEPSSEPTTESTTAPTELVTEPTLPEIETNTSENNLSDTQLNSIAMLNYLAILAQKIDSSSNSRMFLEEAYASLINNTNPGKIDPLTQTHINSILYTIDKYRMVEVKRERLQYLYEQNKATVLKEAFPNSVGLISAISSSSWKQLVASVTYMAVDSFSSYQTYTTEVDKAFLQDSWDLDDEASENLHQSRSRTFDYMIEVVRNNKIPDELTINEQDVMAFVEWKNKTNTYQKIEYFESHKETYQSLGDYWLTLASCYYDIGDYINCLAAIDTYESLQIGIFRKDFYFAQALPIAIASAHEVYSTEDYIPIAERYLDLLKENTDTTKTSEWALRYFAAEIYLDLYVKTDNRDYLINAYEIVYDNVIELLEEQKGLNSAYLSDVQQASLPEKATKAEKKQIKEYNKAIESQRKIELPPIYEPLRLNCELLFSLTDELNITDVEKNRVDNVLHHNGERIFLDATLDNMYRYDLNNFSFFEDEIEIILGKGFFTIPTKFTSSLSSFRLLAEGKIVTDWEVSKVDRNKSNNIDEFITTYSSKDASDLDYTDGSTVTLEVYTSEDSFAPTLTFTFKVQKQSVSILTISTRFIRT